MEFLVNTNRKILRLTCILFIVACMLGVDADLSIAMGGKACKKLRGQISVRRTNYNEGLRTYRELFEAMVRASGDADLYRSLKNQIIDFSDELYKDKQALDAKEALYDGECRPPK